MYKIVCTFAGCNYTFANQLTLESAENIASGIAEDEQAVIVAE